MTSAQAASSSTTVGSTGSGFFLNEKLASSASASTTFGFGFDFFLIVISASTSSTTCGGISSTRASALGCFSGFGLLLKDTWVSSSSSTTGLGCKNKCENVAFETI